MLESGWIAAAGNTTHREHHWDATPGVNGVITSKKQLDGAR